MATITTTRLDWSPDEDRNCIVYTYSTPLDADDDLLGPTIDARKFASVFVTIETDQDCTLQMQFSEDGTNFDRVKQIDIDQTIGSGSVHGLGIVTHYFRVRVINGSTNQGALRIQQSFHESRSPFLVSSPNQTISRVNDVQLTRTTNDPYLDVSAGLFADRFTVHKFGDNSDVGTASFEDIWDAGGTYTWPTAAETVRVRSGGNTNDTAAGTGAQKIIVQGLDTNFDPVEEEITLAGSSASSSTTATFRRVYRAYVTDSGAYGGNNTGDILIENTSTNQLLADIQAGKGQTEMSMYTVPAGHKAYLRRVTMEVEASKPAEVRFWQRQNADDVTTPFTAPRIVHDTLALEGTENIEFAVFPEFPEKTDLWMDAIASSGGGATQVDIAYDLVVVKSLTPVTPQ